MTRTEQAKRRQAILDAVNGGETRAAAARQFNVCRDTVDKACQGYGFLSLRENNERLWVARYLYRRIRTLSDRRGRSMLRLTNELIRRGLSEFKDDELRPGR